MVEQLLFSYQARKKSSLAPVILVIVPAVVGLVVGFVVVVPAVVVEIVLVVVVAWVGIAINWCNKQTTRIVLNFGFISI